MNVHDGVFGSVEDALDAACAGFSSVPGPKREEQVIPPRSPQELDWRPGPLPAVETVPYGTMILVWITDRDTGAPRHIAVAHPEGNSLNPVRWGSSTSPLLDLCTDYNPVRRVAGRVTWWAPLITHTSRTPHPNMPPRHAEWDADEEAAGLRPCAVQTRQIPRAEIDEVIRRGLASK